MKKYVLGLDFGTLSGRALLVDVATGEEVACGVKEYAHGVMSDALPDGTPLPPESAVQDPRDYLDVLRSVIRQVLDQAGVVPQAVIGVGVDFTSCTILPVDRDGQPLCCRPEFASRPNAYVNLWKDHTAAPYVEYIRKTAEKTDPDSLISGGGRVFVEYLVPKCYKILQEDPEVYASCWRIMEAGNWLTLLLTGKETLSPSFAAFKSMWRHRGGYPDRSFFAALDPRMADFADQKLGGEAVICRDSFRVGELSEEGAALVGLCPGTPLSIPLIDAHASLPGAGITRAGKLMIIMGTSFCHLLLSEKYHPVPGLIAVVEDGLIPGYYFYEGGQCSGGDHLDWFVKNCVPASYTEEAARRGISVHQLLREKSEGQRPGQSGLLALDWFNGNRSVLLDTDLSGMVVGYTLNTRPEEVYRALVESTVFGTRRIVDAMTEAGVEIDSLYASGGIARKDRMMMQIMADVVNRPIQVVSSHQAPALGAAVFAAVAAGSAQGGYDTVDEAAAALACGTHSVYTPDPERVCRYGELYREYRRLHDYFGAGENNVMKRLKQFQQEAFRE